MHNPQEWSGKTSHYIIPSSLIFSEWVFITLNYVKGAQHKEIKRYLFQISLPRLQKSVSIFDEMELKQYFALLAYGISVAYGDIRIPEGTLSIKGMYFAVSYTTTHMGKFYIAIRTPLDNPANAQYRPSNSFRIRGWGEAFETFP